MLCRVLLHAVNLRHGTDGFTDYNKYAPIFRLLGVYWVAGVSYPNVNLAFPWHMFFPPPRADTELPWHNCYISAEGRGGRVMLSHSCPEAPRQQSYQRTTILRPATVRCDSNCFEDVTKTEPEGKSQWRPIETMEGFCHVMTVTDLMTPHTGKDDVSGSFIPLRWLSNARHTRNRTCFFIAFLLVGCPPHQRAALAPPLTHTTWWQASTAMSDATRRQETARKRKLNSGTNALRHAALSRNSPAPRNPTVHSSDHNTPLDTTLR
jgi:hypothetical protein